MDKYCWTHGDVPTPCNNAPPKHLDIKTTPEVFITQKSTPTEVRGWLKQKKFSQR